MFKLFIRLRYFAIGKSPICTTDEFKLGSVKTDHNVIDVSLVYRNNLRSYEKSKAPSLVSNLKHLSDTEEMLNYHIEKQSSAELLLVKTDHFTVEDTDEDSQRRKKDRHFLPAFASNQPHFKDLPQFLDLPDEAFRHLLPANYESDSLLFQSSEIKKKEQFKEDSSLKSSEPIRIPNSRKSKNDLDQEILNCKNNSSPGCSSLGSFVIVDMKTPFAPNDQNDLGSFFNGPSPIFQENNLADELEDITTQLAQMETNCQEWNSFVESITSSHQDEEV